MNESIAVIGRFQPFHWGHFDYVSSAAKLSDTLIIGLTNPDVECFYSHDTNPRRSLLESNPFTFDERCAMIRDSLTHLTPWITCRFRRCIFGTPETLRESLGEIDVVVVTVYDKWGRHRADLLGEAGY